MSDNQVRILTKEGKQELLNEYKDLLEVQRPKVIEELSEARAQGDLSENAEFDAAREKQGIIEERIRTIEAILDNSKIIAEQKNTDIIRIGSKFVLEDGRTNNKKEFMIVGSQEANPFEGKISNESPIAISVIGKTKGDTAIVEVDEKFKVKIIEIKK